MTHTLRQPLWHLTCRFFSPWPPSSSFYGHTQMFASKPGVWTVYPSPLVCFCRSSGVPEHTQKHMRCWSYWYIGAIWISVLCWPSVVMEKTGRQAGNTAGEPPCLSGQRRGGLAGRMRSCGFTDGWFCKWSVISCHSRIVVFQGDSGAPELMAGLVQLMTACRYQVKAAGTPRDCHTLTDWF